MKPIGTLNKENAFEIDGAAFADAVSEALKGKGIIYTNVPAKEETPVSHQGMNFGGILPTGNDLKAAALGGYGGLALSRAIGTMVQPLSHPVARDLAAYVIIKKFGGKVLKGESKDFAEKLLLFDAIRSLFPVIDQQIGGVVSKLPVVLKGAPIGIPSFGGGTAAAVASSSQGQGGGSLVVNRLAVTNI